MIAARIVLIILKALFYAACILLFLYSIEFAMQEKKEYRYDNNGWLIISIVWVVLLVPISIMVFSSFPYWTWYKVLICFFPFFPIAIIGSDPHDLLEDTCSKGKNIFNILFIVAILFPVGLGCTFSWRAHSYNKYLIENNDFKYADIHSYRKCTEMNDPEHTHIEYYDQSGYIKSMKLYPKKTVKDLSEVDPRELIRSDKVPVIISDCNKIAYLYQDEKGIMHGPMVLYCTQHFYDSYIKILNI